MLNTSNKMVVLRRREMVATLRCRGRTQREIQEILSKDARFHNPKTRTPWSLGTINADIQKLEADWRIQAFRTIDDHKSLVLAELEAVKKAAWDAKNFKAILTALKGKRDLLGLDAPKRSELSGPGGGAISVEGKGLAALLNEPGTK